MMLPWESKHVATESAFYYIVLRLTVCCYFCLREYCDTTWWFRIRSLADICKVLTL